MNHYDYSIFELWLSRCLQVPYLSYSMYLQNKTNANMRLSKPSPLLTSLLPKQSSKQSPRSLSGKESSLHKVTMEGFDSTALFDEDDDDKRILLSVSRMNAYFKCPYAFYLQYILGLTGVPSFFLSYGTSIHGCIQDLTPVHYVYRIIIIIVDL